MSNSTAPKSGVAQILTETVIPLRDVSKHLPMRPCYQTVWRWTTRGLRGAKLESIKLGKQSATSVEAVHRFLEASQGA